MEMDFYPKVKFLMDFIISLIKMKGSENRQKRYKRKPLGLQEIFIHRKVYVPKMGLRCKTSTLRKLSLKSF